MGSLRGPLQHGPDRRHPWVQRPHNSSEHAPQTGTYSHRASVGCGGRTALQTSALCGAPEKPGHVAAFQGFSSLFFFFNLINLCSKINLEILPPQTGSVLNFLCKQ